MSTPKKLTPTRIELLKWFELSFRLQAITNILNRAFNSTSESQVVSAMYDTHTEYTRLLSEKIGDVHGWLYWYLWDNDGGAREMKAKASKWKRRRPIRTLEDLEQLINDCKP